MDTETPVSSSVDCSTTTVDLIRHGEPVGGHMYRGHKDDPLSNKGWQQMRDAIAKYEDWDAVITSPLKRCALFAQEVARSRNIPLDLENRFKEILWGAWEGCSVDHIHNTEPGKLHAFWQNPMDHTPEGAENVEDFQHRVLAAWHDLLEKYRNRRILVVGHAGITRVLLSHVMDMPLKNLFTISVANAAITRINITHSDSTPHYRFMYHG